MHHKLRLAVATALLLALSACNNVVSNEPWFTAANTKGAPELRDGLWVMLDDEDCRVKLKKPAERWPDCADAIYVRGREWLGMNWDDSNRHKRVFESWESLPLLLAAGDPVILQLDEGSEPPASDPDELAISNGDDEPHWRYSYAGMQPTEFDSQGRVVAFEFWDVQCGPWHYELKEGEHTIDELSEGYVTEQPFPGLTVVGQRCTAESADAQACGRIQSRDE